MVNALNSTTYATCSARPNEINNLALIRSKIANDKIVRSGYQASASFENYSHQTSQALASNYGWYTVPTSVHKLLKHNL